MVFSRVPPPGVASVTASVFGPGLVPCDFNTPPPLTPRRSLTPRPAFAHTVFAHTPAQALEWLAAHGCPLSPGCWAAAAGGGNSEDKLEWMRRRGCPLPQVGRRGGGGVCDGVWWGVLGRGL